MREMSFGVPGRCSALAVDMASIAAWLVLKRRVLVSMAAGRTMSTVTDDAARSSGEG
jgi:hypothetical protein